MMDNLNPGYLPLFMFIVKFIAPVAIAMVFLYSLGSLSEDSDYTD